MSTMPKPYPQEFRDDVVAVARKGRPGSRLLIPHTEHPPKDPPARAV